MENKILVVDDEASFLDMLKEVFESAGYTVLTATSAEDALKIIKNDTISLMLLDINLPGMNGVDLCKKIRIEHHTSIIYAVTGYSDIYGPLECHAAGFDDFFGKPVKLDLLLNAARAAFEELKRRETCTRMDLA